MLRQSHFEEASQRVLLVEEGLSTLVLTKIRQVQFMLTLADTDAHVQIAVWHNVLDVPRQTNKIRCFAKLDGGLKELVRIATYLCLDILFPGEWASV